MKKSNGAHSRPRSTPSLSGEGSHDDTTAATPRRPRAAPGRAEQTPADTEDERKPQAPAPLEFAGKIIGTFKALEAETDFGRCELLRDETGEDFYLITTKSAANQKAVVRLNTSEAVAWATQQCLKGWDLERFVNGACAGFVCMIKDEKSFGLSKRLGSAVARNVRLEAAKEGRTPFEQIRALIVEGLASPHTRERSRRWAKRHGVADCTRGHQLQLATALVEVVRKLQTAPSEKMFKDAVLASEELTRSLRGEGEEKLSVVR